MSTITESQTQIWVVTRTDGSETLVEVKALSPEYRSEYAARAAIGREAFAARPKGCTGFAYNVHFGAECACPVHGG